MRECIKRYIRGDEGKVAFRCYSKEEVEDLTNIVKEIIYPSYYEGLNFIADDFGKGRYACEMCVRVEYRNGYFDYGKSEAKFYMSRGRKIIDFCDIKTPDDLGEFVVQPDAVSLLFGGAYVV